MSGSFLGDSVIAPGDVVIADANGVAVAPIDKAAEILQQAQRLLGTEHLVQDNIKAGATIGELVNIDEVIRMTFSYQDEASQRD